MITALGMAVETSIKTALEKASSRARALPIQDSFGGLDLTYTRLLSCLLFPHALATSEEGEMWKADGYKLLREWVGNSRSQSAVAAAKHAAALEFLDSYDGKVSLMAGLVQRLELLNSNPCYDPAAFSSSLMFEKWKMGELASVEHQRGALLHFNKTELRVNVYSVRAVAEVGVETLAQAVGDPVGAVRAANSKMFGIGRSMLDKSYNTTKTYSSLFSASPVSAAVRGTKGLLSTSVQVTKMTLMSPATVTQTLSRTRADLWCTLSFAAYQHTSPVVGDVTPEEAKVALETEVVWEVRPGEHAALCVNLFRKRNFAVEITEVEAEMLGSVMLCWDDLLESGQLGQAHEGWFRCDEGNFDVEGRPVPGSREICLRVELLTKPIESAQARALFDQGDNLHRVYTDLYRGLPAGMVLLPSPPVEWLLHELRVKCGVSRRWHDLLRLAAGLNLNVSEARCKEEAVQVREGRLVALLGCVRELDKHDADDSSAGAVPLAVMVGLRQALRFVQGQVRNGLLTFPYKLALGVEDGGEEEEEEYQEPTELKLLCLIDEAINEQLDAQERSDSMLASHRMGVHPSARLPTDEVVAEGLQRFMRLFYAHHLEQSLRKDAAAGKTRRLEEHGPRHWAAHWALPQGEVMGKHVKKVVKRAAGMLERLHLAFAHVISEAVLRGAVEQLVSMVTVDVLSLISAYHLRGQAFDAFQEASEEAMLLKLHLRANHLRHAVATYQPDVACDALATAASPLLSQWVQKTHDNLRRWIEQATSIDTWQPAAGLGAGGPSSSLIDVFSAAEHACNTFLGVRMAVQVSLRLQFVALLESVCTDYLASLDGFARREQSRLLAQVRVASA